MSTLILTSSGKFITNNNIDEYLPKKLSDCKIAYISTASKKVLDASFALDFQARMTALNLDYTDIDILDLKETELKTALTGYDIVLVEGGNTYYLLKAVRESGFKNIIKDLIAKGVVYIGTSAGSYIACPSIIVTTFSERGFDRFGVTDFTAMNLVPFFIKAHYKPEMDEKLKQMTKKLSAPLRVLNDEQALLVRDGEIQLLGGGQEITISPL